MRIPNVAILRDTKFNKMDVDQSYTSMYVTKSMNKDIYEPVDTTVFSVECDKEKTKFIKMVEKFVRGSYEYGELRNYLNVEMDMNHCSFFEGVTSYDNRRMKIEIHHSPMTLYDITEVIVSKHYAEYKCLNIYKIAQEVMEVHFRGLVGLIPLSETVHELVHNGVVFIPVNYVYGYVSKFIDEYGDYIDKEMMTALRRNIDASKEFIKTPDILKPKYVYFTEGFSLPRSDIFGVQQTPNDNW